MKDYTGPLCDTERCPAGVRDPHPPHDPGHDADTVSRTVLERGQSHAEVDASRQVSAPALGILSMADELRHMADGMRRQSERMTRMADYLAGLSRGETVDPDTE